MAAVVADLVLVVHAAFVAFVVFGLLLTVVGLIRRWCWVRNAWFRGAHLLAITVVVALTWSGVMCPLTTWENRLRAQAGEAGYDVSFIAHWLHATLFHEAEPWVFTVAYTIFGALVVAAWVLGPPRWPKRSASS